MNEPNLRKLKYNIYELQKTIRSNKEKLDNFIDEYFLKLGKLSFIEKVNNLDELLYAHWEETTDIDYTSDGISVQVLFSEVSANNDKHIKHLINLFPESDIRFVDSIFEKHVGYWHEFLISGDDAKQYSLSQ